MCSCPKYCIVPFIAQMLYGKEQKGPVSALTQVNGYLVSAIGQKVQYQYKGQDLCLNNLLFMSGFLSGLKFY